MKFNAKRCQKIILSLVFLIIAGYLFYIGSLIGILPLLAVVLVWLNFEEKKENVNTIQKIEDVVEKAYNGEIHHRIILDDDKTMEEKIGWNINEMLDQIEDLLREAENTINAITNGEDYRYIMTSGLHGKFGKVAKGFENAIN